MNILEINNLTKKFGDFKALNDFSANIPTGVTGLLGPNGAGKTTLIRTILGIHTFESGTIKFNEFELPRDIVKAKDYLGYQPEVDTTIRKTSAMRYVVHMARLAGLPRSAAKQRSFDVLHYVGLEEARYRDMNTFSQGMMQKVKLATALVHDPLLIILDEPTAGCDPESHEQILNLIKDLGRNHDKNLLVSTHLLHDIEQTANQVVVMSQGRRLIQGDLKTILASKGETETLEIRVSGNHEKFAEVLNSNGLHVTDISDSHISCISNLKTSNSTIFKLAQEADMNVRMISKYKQSLEDVFLEAVKNGAVLGND